MPDENPVLRSQPLRDWLPLLLLKFLTFLVFLFVLYEATAGLGERDLDGGRVAVTIAGMVGMLLLLVVERLTALRLSARGVEVEATLTQAKARALGEINEMEHRELAQAARAQILEDENPDQVRGAVALAVELNVNRVVDRVVEAIYLRRRV